MRATYQPKATTYDEPLWQLAGTITSLAEARSLREDALEGELYETHSLLAAIVASSDDAIISNDLFGIIIGWNAAAERIFGYSAKEIVGKPTSILASPHCQEDTAYVLEKIRSGERVFHYETLRRHKDGSDIAVSLTVTPVRNAAGAVIGASKVARDITATRQAEEALRNTDKLALAGRLAASIAHEINNPLEAITNLLYLIEHEALPEQARHYLMLAQHELTRVSHIASQTLGFFRNAPDSAPGSLSDILDSAISLNAGRIATCNVTFEKSYLPLMPLNCNQGELRQVFVNLVANALDAMPAGGRLLIRIREATGPASGTPGIRITVADTGVGMSSRTRRALFEPFYTTKGATGTGLGLWVSQQIVTRHKGQISVRSSQDNDHHGSVLSVFLPRLNDLPDAAAAARAHQLPLPIDGAYSTSHEGESRRTPAQPDPPSTAYTAA